MKTIFSPKLILFLVLGLLVSSCSDNMLNRKGTAPADEATFTSRIPVPVDIKNKPDNIAICNATEMTTVTKMNFLQAQSMVYYDTAKQPRYNAIRLWIPKINAEFAKNNYHIDFYKWKANLTDKPYRDTTKLQVRMEKKIDKKNASGYMASLNWEQMKVALALDVVDVSNMATIFTNYSFVVFLDKPQDTQAPIAYDQDPAVEFDVLKIAVYKDSALIEEKDFLLPAFYAHPLTFSEGKPDVLKQLHPHIADLNTSWPGSHFAEKSNAYCF